MNKVDWFNLNTGAIIRRPEDWDNPHGNFARVADTDRTIGVDARGRERALTPDQAREAAQAKTQGYRVIYTGRKAAPRWHALAVAAIVAAIVSSAVVAISALLGA